MLPGSSGESVLKKATYQFGFSKFTSLSVHQKEIIAFYIIIDSYLSEACRNFQSIPSSFMFLITSP